MAAPPRLFVFLAREAPVGLILRRGPTAWVHLTLWRTDSDSFSHGQWMKARVYEERCDLSPDGSLFLYFARKGSPTGRQDGYGSAWTALSRPPYFTALALWPQNHTWFGGGLFEDRRSVVLHGCGPEAHPDHPPDADLTARSVPGKFVTGWVFAERLKRDGWQVEGDWPGQRQGWASMSDPPSTWRRVHRSGKLTLVMMCSGAPTPSFHVEADDLRLPLTSAEWADWDQRGRLILTREGRLLAHEPTPAGLGEPRELADFNALEPNPEPAPAWASHWRL